MNFLVSEVGSAAVTPLLSMLLIAGVWSFITKKSTGIAVFIAAAAAFYALSVAKLVHMPFPASTSLEKVLALTCIFALVGAFIHNTKLDNPVVVSLLTLVIAGVAIYWIGARALSMAAEMEEPTGPITNGFALAVGGAVALSLLIPWMYKDNISGVVTAIGVLATYGVIFLIFELGTISSFTSAMASLFGGYCLINWLRMRFNMASMILMLNAVVISTLVQMFSFAEEGLSKKMLLLPLLTVIAPYITKALFGKKLENHKYGHLIHPVVTGIIALLIGGAVMYYVNVQHGLAYGGEDAGADGGGDDY